MCISMFPGDSNAAGVTSTLRTLLKVMQEVTQVYGSGSQILGSITITCSGEGLIQCRFYRVNSNNPRASKASTSRDLVHDSAVKHLSQPHSDKYFF